MLRPLLPMLAVLAWAGCASLGEVDTCDPGYVAAKLQAMALECRTKRMRECPGVTQDAFERDPQLCPAVRDCYTAMDRTALECLQ